MTLGRSVPPNFDKSDMSVLTDLDYRIFSVKTYGAIGQNDTDDIVAIDAAVAAANASTVGGGKATVFFPGFHRTSRPIRVPPGNGMVFRGCSNQSSVVFNASPGEDTFFINNVFDEIRFEHLQLYLTPGGTGIHVGPDMTDNWAKLELDHVRIPTSDTGSSYATHETGLKIEHDGVGLYLSHITSAVDTFLQAGVVDVVGVPVSSVLLASCSVRDSVFNFGQNLGSKGIFDINSQFMGAVWSNSHFEGPFPKNNTTASMRLMGNVGIVFIASNWYDMDSGGVPGSPLFKGDPGWQLPGGLTFIGCTVENNNGSVFDWGPALSSGPHIKGIESTFISGNGQEVFRNFKDTAGGITLDDSGVIPTQKTLDSNGRFTVTGTSYGIEGFGGQHSPTIFGGRAIVGATEDIVVLDANDGKRLFHVAASGLPEVQGHALRLDPDGVVRWK